MKFMRAQCLLLGCLSLLCLTACNEEKAVAMQTMAGNLAASIEQIESRLDTYWGNVQPAGGPLDKQEQIDSLATFLLSNRERIAASDDAIRTTGSNEDEADDGALSEDDVIEMIMSVPRALDEIDTLSEQSNPFSSGIASIRQRAAAVRDAVQFLDKGSYFAADAVMRLQRLLGSIGRDLIALDETLTDSAAVAEQVNRAGQVDFLVPSDRILAAVRDGNPTLADLRTIIATELDRGFAARAARSQSRDEISARILKTAEMSLEMATAARDYGDLGWDSLMGMLSDLSALASAIELPEEFQVAIGDTRARLAARAQEIRELTAAGID